MTIRFMTGGPEFAVSTNPATGEEIARYRFASPAEVEKLLATAHAAYADWSARRVAERGHVLSRMATVLRQRKTALAEMCTREMGKPIAQSRAEVEKCAAVCDWCEAHAEEILRDEPSLTVNDAWISWLPTGALLGVMPWNFPYWQAMRGAAAALVTGNVYVLKPAPNVVGCAQLLADCWLEAGAPEGAFSVLSAGNSEVSLAIQDDRITGVMFTGSKRGGAAIAFQAGAALKKSVLELGGSDPFVVLADADLDIAVPAAITARFQNTGQVCIAAKRFLLEAPIAAEFTQRFVEAAKALRIGNPMDEQNYLGPLARPDLRNTLEQQVEGTIAAGAEVLLRGGSLPGEGNFYAPTVLANVTLHMPAFCEETFGPVAAITVARNAEHALELANATEYGLNASIWSADSKRAAGMARRLKSGAVFLNCIPASDPRMPIGGVKHSGYGRELSIHGAREFLNAQTVWRDRS